ncbi:MAG: hypothetical protein SF162_15965 [bacterium]|nr:hypothetical protein [bacterium]
MASDQARELRQRGIAAAKAGQKEDARALLQQSIRIEPNNEAAWLWLASVARDAAERRFCLEKLLEINPNNETALKALGAMPAETGLRRIGEQKRATSDREIPAAPPPPADAAVSVPLPPPEKIAEAQRQIDALIRETDGEIPQTYKYVHKTRRRAGEGDIVVYRAYLTAGAIGVLALIIVVFAVIVTTNDDAAEIVFGPSATPSSTPTITLTPTPGLTPTPSPQPSESPTASPTIPPGVTPADLRNLPRATPFNPPLLDNAQNNAVAALFRGQVQIALPTLAAAREASIDSGLPLEPEIYYYEALALVEQGSAGRALDLLQEAEERREEDFPNDREKQAVIDAAFVPVYLALAQQADQGGDPVRATELYDQMEERADQAIQVLEELPGPYLYMARRYIQQRQFDQATRILNQGLAIPDLRTNAELLSTRAEALYGQGSRAMADYQAYLTLLVDPTNITAHLLRITIALEQDRPGDAVLRAQDYLLMYPGSREGYRLLGDAHRASGDDNLALEAYTRGLSGAADDEAAFTLYARRGDLYLSRRQYDLAREDYTEALGIRADVDVQLQRMEAAYYAGAYAIAVRDSSALVNAAGQDAWRAQLFGGRALIAESPDDRSGLEQARSLLRAAAAAAPADARGTAFESLAQAELGLRDLDSAAESIAAALTAGDTPSRRYLNGLILEAQGERAAAALEYQWALTLSEIVPFAGRGEIEDRLADLT